MTRGPIRAAATLAALACTAAPAGAAELDITISNLTNGITFRPFLVTASGPDNHIAQLGQPASAALQAMAECGDISMLVAAQDAQGADSLANPVGTDLGLLFPAGTAPPASVGVAGSVSGSLSTQDGNTHLSVVGMLLPTNDAFAALDAVEIPTEPGTYQYLLNAYDAGTEANNEVAADPDPSDCVSGEPGYPVDPLGNDGSNGLGLDTPDVNNTVHVHRNHLGDADPTGGASDLDSSVHRWLNPVIRLTVVVN